MTLRAWTGWLAGLALIVFGSAANAGDDGAWHLAPAPLVTRWAKDVSPTNALPEYPRPQMVRKDWQSLNGLWDYGLSDAGAAKPESFTGKILVPYPWESALSGVGKTSIPGQRLWYRRSFTIPVGWKSRHVLAHFGAVNWDATVSVNGKPVASHRGGYDGFSTDITGSLRPGSNEMIVSAWNPIRSDVADAQVLGKQRVRPGGIFYTAATGIWQSVWLEPVPTQSITGLKMVPDIDKGILHLTVQTNAPNGVVGVTARDGSKVVATASTARTDNEIILRIPAAHLWSPSDPHLYDLKVSLFRDGMPSDTVSSYFAMRKVSLGKDAQGRNRLFLNNKFVFEVGALDQGYWPDGIYTAPTDNALRYDIEIAKKLGYNLLRKHAKVEPDRWYYWTDKLGMLVWQDMPQMFAGRGGALSDEAKQEFAAEWRRIIAQHYNSPSIIVWTTFNEGWGQHDTPEVVALTKQLDPTRLVNNASGWTDMHVGDIADTHAYPGPRSGQPEATRAAVNGEFGGVTMRVGGHMWTSDVFGYGSVLQNSWLVTRRYQQLLKNAYRLRDEQGASAVVYTQITDVEQESNGILTYDRALIKPDVALTTAANEGRFPPLPPNPNPDLVPTSEDEPLTWQYTTDRAGDDWARTDFDDKTWKTGPAGFGHGLGGVRTEWTTGDIYLRRTVTLPDAIPDRLAFLTMHDEDVEIYINGVLAASATGYTGQYVKLPMNEAGRAALHPGANVIAVHCHQTIGGQFIDVGITAAGAPRRTGK